MSRSTTWFAWSLAILSAGILFQAVHQAHAAADDAQGRVEIVVHEWGTFTVLQDDNGQQLGGLNVDDEPVPPFVYNLRRDLLTPAIASLYYSKGLPARLPFVAVRLETPVIYFYPVPGARPRPFDVEVSLHGGWLTEFFPQAEATAPGLDLKPNRLSVFRGDGPRFRPITADTIGKLAWRGLTLGGNRPVPTTTEKVWLAPRATKAVPVITRSGESEKYLFYRGVGNFSAPLTVRQTPSDGKLEIRGNFDEALASGEEANVSAVWLVHIRPDGRAAFRSVGPLTASADRNRVLATASSRFAEEDYRAENMNELKAKMHTALTAEGLFADEAHAMLATWERAYFKTHGLRLFFTVPQVWTDARMPLRISAPSRISRIMMGRIELVSPEQRVLLTKLASATISDRRWFDKAPDSPARRQLAAGRSDFGNLGAPIPADFQAYLDMGRFRNALVVAENRARPTPSLQKFIKLYQLDRFDPPVATPRPLRTAQRAPR